MWESAHTQTHAHTNTHTHTHASCILNAPSVSTEGKWYDLHEPSLHQEVVKQVNPLKKTTATTTTNNSWTADIWMNSKRLPPETKLLSHVRQNCHFFLSETKKVFWWHGWWRHRWPTYDYFPRLLCPPPHPQKRLILISPVTLLFFWRGGVMTSWALMRLDDEVIRRQ